MPRVAIHSTTDPVEAEFVRGLLENEGLTATIAPASSEPLGGSINPGSPLLVVMVASVAAVHAQEVLRAALSVAPEPLQFDNLPPATSAAASAQPARSPRWWQSGWFVGALTLLAATEALLLATTQQPGAALSGTQGDLSWRYEGPCLHSVWARGGKDAEWSCDQDGNGIAEEFRLHDRNGRLLVAGYDSDKNGITDMVDTYDLEGRHFCRDIDADQDHQLETTHCFSADGRPLLDRSSPLARDATFTEYLAMGGHALWIDSDHDGRIDRRQVFTSEGTLLLEEVNHGARGFQPVMLERVQPGVPAINPANH